MSSKAPKAQSSSKPDYTERCGFTGGHLADLPKPHIPLYSKHSQKLGVRRPVHVSIMVFYGLGRHYYVDIREEANAFWDSRTDPVFRTGPHWARPWRLDPKHAGRSEHGRFDNMLDATRFVREVVKKYFPKTTHIVSDEQQRTRWFYREGD